MKKISIAIIVFVFLTSSVFAQAQESEVNTSVTVPDITANGVGSDDFHSKGVAALNFFEKFRLDLKKTIEDKKSTYVRSEKSISVEVRPEGEVSINSEKTINDLESANEDVLYYFLVFALFIVSSTFLFYGLIVVLVLVVLRTLFSPR